MKKNNIGKDQRIWVKIKDGEKYYCITSDLSRQKYTLYEIRGSEYIKIASSNNPSDLEDNYIWKD